MKGSESFQNMWNDEQTFPLRTDSIESTVPPSNYNFLQDYFLFLKNFYYHFLNYLTENVCDWITEGCSDLFLHLTEQVDHHHTTLCISVSHSHPATRAGNQQLVCDVAVWENAETHSQVSAGAMPQILQEMVDLTDLSRRCFSPLTSSQQPSDVLVSAWLRSV